MSDWLHGSCWLKWTIYLGLYENSAAPRPFHKPSNVHPRTSFYDQVRTHKPSPPPPFFYSGSWPLLVMTLHMSQTFPRYCAFVSLPPLLAWPLTCSWLLPSCFLFSMIKKPGQQQRRDRSLRMPKADNQRALLHSHLSLCATELSRGNSNERLGLEVTFEMLCNNVYFAKHPRLPFWLSVFANIGPFGPVLCESLTLHPYLYDALNVCSLFVKRKYILLSV